MTTPPQQGSAAGPTELLVVATPAEVLLAAGAAAYGPTPDPLDGRVAKRVDAVVHPDLVEGTSPLLLSERAVPARAVALAHLRAVVAQLPAPAAVPAPTTLVLGRAAPWAGALDAAQRGDLLAAMVSRCAEAGHSRLLVLLDEDAPPRVRRQLDAVARAVRADLTVVTDAGPAERWSALDGVALVVGCASDDLLVARAVLGRRTAQLDTDRVLKRLEPFSDPRRTAATLVCATLPDLRSWTASPDGEEVEPPDLPGLVTTVGYAMEPERLAGRRAEAIAFLRAHPATRRRYVRRRRLSELRLPGGKRKVRPSLG